MGRIGPGQFRVNHLLVFVAYCAIVLASLMHASDLDRVSRSWYLTLIAVVLPWTTLVLVRPSIRPGPLRDWLTLTLKWLPVWLILGLLLLHKPLGLDEEFWMAPLVGLCYFAVPPILVVKVLRVFKRDASLDSRSHRPRQDRNRASGPVMTGEPLHPPGPSPWDGRRTSL